MQHSFPVSLTKTITTIDCANLGGNFFHDLCDHHLSVVGGEHYLWSGLWLADPNVASLHYVGFECFPLRKFTISWTYTREPETILTSFLMIQHDMGRQIVWPLPTIQASAHVHLCEIYIQWGIGQRWHRVTRNSSQGKLYTRQLLAWSEEYISYRSRLYKFCILGRINPVGILSTEITFTVRGTRY